MPAKTLKAADKHTILRKLVTEMKRRFGGSLPKHQRSVFETLLFAACLEDCSPHDAEAAYARLMEAFFDLNEIRVSSVSEIESVLRDLPDAAWKAMRIRESLQYVFERHYAFDLEYLRRKTHEVAIKELSQIPHQTLFMRTYVLEHALGAHVLPIDRTMNNLLVWLGLADSAGSAEETGEDLKSAVKKSEAMLLCHLLKCTASDPALLPSLGDGRARHTAPDPFEAPQRLVEFFKQSRKKRKKAAAGKAVSLKKPARKAASRTTTSAKSAIRKASKVTKKRPAAKKTTRKRSN